MGRIIRLLFWLSSMIAPAAAFDNIEADALYERAIKEQIRTEFEQGSRMLKNQADGLRMQVREKDVEALRRHMYNKAFMIGRCADKAIGIRKVVSENILVQSYVKGCVDTHLKFMDWIRTAKLNTSMLICTYSARYHNPNPPYDFLGIADAVPTVTDYVGIRDCFENRDEGQKMIDSFEIKNKYP